MPWSDEPKAAFVAMQFEAQSAHYAEHYTGMTSDVVVIDGDDAGRLLVARWAREIRIVDVALLPSFRGRGAGGELLPSSWTRRSRWARRSASTSSARTARSGSTGGRGFRPVGEAGVHLRMQWDPPVP